MFGEPHDWVGPSPTTESIVSLLPGSPAMFAMLSDPSRPGGARQGGQHPSGTEPRAQQQKVMPTAGGGPQPVTYRFSELSVVALIGSFIY